MSTILDRANFPLDETDSQDIPQVLDTLRERRSDLQRLLQSHQKKHSESKSNSTHARERHRHQTRIHEIQTSLHTLNTSIHHHHTLLRRSPIRELPTELLAEIFCIFMDDRIPTATDVLQAQNTLTSVCQRWRATARGTPHLWRSVPLFLPAICGADTSSSFLTNVLRAAHWLRLDTRIAYAKRIPLDLHCHIRTSDDGVAVEQVWARLMRLLPNASSLSLSFTSNARSAFRDYFDLPESVPDPCYPHLHQLLVHSESTDNEAKLTTWVNSLLARSPRISRLTLDYRLGEVMFVSQTLRYVHCQKASPDCLFHILSLATQLVELQIDMVRGGRESDVPFQVTNTSLVRLSLVQSPGRIWDMLTLPALRYLDLDCSSDAFLAFSKRSGFQLYELKLRYEYLLDDFPDALRAQPSLTSLRLFSSIESGPPLSLLEFLGDAAELRALETLHMCCTYACSLGVKEMLERRLEGYRTGSLDVSGRWTLFYKPTRGMEDYRLAVVLEPVFKELGRYGLQVTIEEECSW